MGVKSNFYDVCSDSMSLYTLIKAPFRSCGSGAVVIGLFPSWIYIWPITRTGCLTGLSIELSGLMYDTFPVEDTFKQKCIFV